MRKKTYLKLVQYQTEQAKQHLNEVRSIHSEMRGYKHDFHHHLQALKGQLEAGEVERAIAYIEELDHQLMNVDTLLKTGNVSLDAILSAKIAQAKAENIAVDVKASVPDSLTITDVELSILVGNLLDNAIESCRLSSGKRFIRIYMSMKTSVYKGYKQDKIEMRGDRAEMSDFPLYLNTVAGGLDRRDQTIGGFSFVVKIYAVPVVEIIG